MSWRTADGAHWADGAAAPNIVSINVITEGVQMDTLLSVTGLERRYGAVRAVDGLDLQVTAGEVVALLGPNGAGKTTLSNCVIGLLEPHAGEVVVLGGDPRRAAIRRQLGVVQQDVGFPTTLRVGEVVSGAAVRSGRDAVVARAALGEVGLEELARRRASRLSGGQQRRLQLAMALVSDPRLLVLDEPTEGLDVTARRGFWDMLANRRDAGVGVLLTTHAVAEAAEVADRVVVVHDGRVVAEGAPDTLTARVAPRRIRARTTVPLPVIAAWPEVASASAQGEAVEIVATPVEAVVRRLLDHDPDLADLTVTAATLADALVALDTAMEDIT